MLTLELTRGPTGQQSGHEGPLCSQRPVLSGVEPLLLAVGWILLCDSCLVPI